jgi:hypothetical protein
MNRNRWWSLALLFLLVNALGLWRALFLWDAHLGRLDGGARLKSSPASEQVVVGRAPLRWVWTAPVVADEAVGQVPSNAPVTFDPPHRGRFVWVSDRVLEFQPSEDWPAARRVRLHHQLSGRQVRETWSGADGVYRFDLLRLGVYYVVGLDHSMQFDPEAKSDLTPEPMP